MAMGAEAEPPDPEAVVRSFDELLAADEPDVNPESTARADLLDSLGLRR